uniref:Putative O-methyltransferase n=1 Tax=Eschscholzia californica TaxID=3467 RepID=C3SBS3_ESCCA|nr:putative O-methyltransferase [Eschscholzia californica]
MEKGKLEVGEEMELQGQADICKLMLAFIDSMALKCAVELGIPDIIHSHGQPITLSEIINGIPNLSPSFDINYLFRIMRLLVRNRVFSAYEPDLKDGSSGTKTLYGLTPSSKWLVKDSKISLAPLVLAENHPWLLDPWHYLGKCVQEGGFAFAKAHGSEIWKFGSENPEFNKLFSVGMACSSTLVVDAILDNYHEGFGDLESIVDVGGAIGTLINEIVKKYPHIRGTNFDLPHVVAEALENPGVAHVGGDMFVEIPSADAVILKWVLHDWNDEDCVKILKNCNKAISNKGKLIIIECVLKPDGEGLFDGLGLAFDLLMIAHSSGGRERTEAEWKKLLKAGGFSRYKITPIKGIPSIIEAYPDN